MITPQQARMILDILIGLFIGIGVISGALLFYFLGKSAQRENINRCSIDIDCGSQVVTRKGKCIHTSVEGKKYQYRYNGAIHEILVPDTYKPRYRQARRLLAMNSSGSLVALPFEQSEKLSKSEREDLIKEITMSQLLAQAVKAMRGKITSSILIIAVIIALLIGIAGTYMFVKNQQKNQTTKTTQTTQTTQPTQPTNTPPVIIPRE